MTTTTILYTLRQQLRSRITDISGRLQTSFKFGHVAAANTEGSNKS